jgi:hypothetical protein
VTDLYAIKFDPVFRDRDVTSYTDGDPARPWLRKTC